MTATWADAIAAAAARLAGRVDDPRLEAEMLLARALGEPRSRLHTWPRRPLPEADRVRFETLLARRLAGEPMAYIFGHREFWSLRLTVTPDVLIPRPETEQLVETALECLPADTPLAVADLGTGSGAVALAIARERPLARITATDLNPRALDVARANARRHGLVNVEFLTGTWFAPLADRTFDAIVSNPPYVATDDPHLDRGDLRFEPRAALVAEAGGLAALREIIKEAPAFLRDDGRLLLEHGCDQADAVTSALRARGFHQVATRNDLAGHPRISFGRHRGHGHP